MRNRNIVALFAAAALTGCGGIARSSDTNIASENPSLPAQANSAQINYYDADDGFYLPVLPNHRYVTQVFSFFIGADNQFYILYNFGSDIGDDGYPYSFVRSKFVNMLDTTYRQQYYNNKRLFDKQVRLREIGLDRDQLEAVVSAFELQVLYLTPDPDHPGIYRWKNLDMSAAEILEVIAQYSAMMDQALEVYEAPRPDNDDTCLQIIMN